jgi:N-acetylmuramoyl-L-alanine amidase
MSRISKTSFLFVFVFVLWFSGQGTANASGIAFETNRIFGLRQIDTAIEVSKSGWQQADTVILATADNFPDALVAAPLSHRLNAPVLLNHQDTLDPKVLKEINRLGAQKIVVLGGTACIGPKVIHDLQNAGKSIERIAGLTQYETAVKVAERLDLSEQVILVNGEHFPDALAISAYAGFTETPILLTNSRALPEVTKAKLRSCEKLIIVGGEAAVPTATLGDLSGIERLAGWDRYLTAAKVYKFAQGILVANSNYLVTGENYPDALVTGALAAKQQAQILMSKTNTLSPVTYSVLNTSAAMVRGIVIIGGTGAISSEVQAMVEGKIPMNALLGDLTIVIDPGHGGPDPGAIGASRLTREKDNTLAVSLALAELLNAQGAIVELTRTTDVSPAGDNYLSGDIKTDLQPRIDLANNLKADLFISIHNNAFTASSHGTETYYSADNPQAVASEELAQAVQSSLVRKLGLYDRGIKEAAFWVIKYTKMPAILIELAFISNPNEEILLSSPDFQIKAAQGIYEGILQYRGL